LTRLSFWRIARLGEVRLSSVLCEYSGVLIDVLIGVLV
jgi:hypothetical protein